MLFVQPTNETSPFALCCLNSKSGNNCVLQHEFGPEDSPVVFWTKGESLHVTGNWIWALSDEDSCCDEDDADDHSEGGGVSNEEVDAETPVEAVEGIVKKRPRENSADESTAAATTEEPIPEKKTGRKKRGKNPIDAIASTEEIVTIARPPSDDLANGRKGWKVKPQNDEGVSVPDPKQRTLSSGVLTTDYVIGRGVTPRLGSVVHIIYDGLFPDGQMFDSNQKRSKPLKFRLGSGQVLTVVTTLAATTTTSE